MVPGDEFVFIQSWIKAVFQDEKSSAQAQKLSEDLDPTKSGMAGIPRQKFWKIRLNNGCKKVQKVG